GSGCSSYAGTQGEPTDMYLYITAVQNADCSAGAAAWARPCLLDLGDNRPLAGAANICPSALGLLGEEALSAVLLHEMIHALGFTESMFNLTRRPDGSHRPLSEVVQVAGGSSSGSGGGSGVSRLVTPAVVAAARAHWGCPGLAGAQLEEEGSAGSAGSHWEYTHYQGEVMVASTIFSASGSPPALSNLTLSYLEDTGWYGVNRSAAGLLSWGAGSGCALPSSPSCWQYMQEVPEQQLFCDPSTGDSSSLCSPDHKAPGMCRSLNFTGGCGMVLSRNAEQTCLGPNAAYDMPDVFGWGTGSPSTRCFPVVYRFQATVGSNRYTFPATGLDGDTDAACFDTSCSPDGTKVYVKLLGRQFECPAGSYLSLPQLLPSRYSSGRIGPCPDPRVICATQSCPASSCSSTGGDCLNGSCYCRLAYTGPDCATNLITGTTTAVTQDASSPDTNTSSNTSSTSSPPPPASVWTQVVQISLELADPVVRVQARAADLVSLLAGWADLRAGAVQLVLVAPASSSSDNTNSSSSSGSGSTAAGESNSGSTSSGAVQQAGQAYDGSFGNSSSPTRRRALQQQSASPPPSLPRSSSPPPAPAAAASVATALLSPPGSAAVAILVGRLRDVTQLQLLYGQLAAAGFAVVPGSASFQTLITKVTASPPPPSSSSSSLSASLSSSSPSSSAQQEDHSRSVVIIAITAGAVAAAGVLVAGVVVAVMRRRRSSSGSGDKLPRRAHRYHA
ncbi:hypothetical protein Agub_g6085, partial [Astrephomene gubernaculifera]